MAVTAEDFPLREVYEMCDRALDTGALVELLMKHRSFDHGGKRIDLDIAKCEADTMAAAVVEYIRGWSGDGA